MSKNEINNGYLKEKIKDFWNNLNKKWMWIGNAIYIILVIIGWIGFFYNFITLETTLLVTFIYPVIFLVSFFVNTSKFKVTFRKILFNVAVALPLGFVIWLALIYSLITAPWALLNGIQPSTLYIVLFLLPSFTVAIIVINIISIRRNL
jgi:hypothetical protein